MEVNEFVTKIRASIVEENLDIYRDIFDNTTFASDAYWKQALDLYQSLDPAQRIVLLSIIRQVTIDTVSSMFAVIDGVAVLNEQKDKFELISGENRISGQLQDIFLGLFET